MSRGEGRAVLRVPLAGLAPGDVELPAEAAAYVGRVHRLGAGDRCEVFDPERGLEALAEVLPSLAAGRRGVRLRVGELRATTRRPARATTLFQAIGKGDKMDAIVRDATELGATRVVPVLAERSVARPDERRAERWRRIAVEAARQCGRGDVPTVAYPMAFAEALAGWAPSPGGRGFCLDPEAGARLGASLVALPPDVEVAFLVGPEGGLTPAELLHAARAGLAPVTLGARVLRTETVCAAVLGALLVLEGLVEG